MAWIRGVSRGWGLVCVSGPALAVAVGCGGGGDVLPSYDAAGLADVFVPDAPSPGDGGEIVAPDTGSSGDVAGFPAPHLPAPHVLNYGGPTLKTPNIVPIFFGGDGDQKAILDFLGQLAASSYWTDATAEYGIGKLTVSPPIVVTDKPPTTVVDAQISAWLTSYVMSGGPGWPAPMLDNIYMVFYPATTTITLPGTGKSCESFGGYHFEGLLPGSADGGLEGGLLEGGADAVPAEGGFLDLSVPDAGDAGGAGDAAVDAVVTTGSKPFVYAVIPRCGMFASFTGLDPVTIGIAHETVEASTDPLPGTKPAYAGVDADHYVWDIAPGGELGDMCEFEPQSYQRLVGAYMVQRIWSNKAAAAGKDPCAPDMSASYFNAAPVLKQEVKLDYQGASTATLGLNVPVGKTAFLDVQLFSDTATGPWTVYFEDSSKATGGPQLLSFSPNPVNGSNGDVATVQVSSIAPGPIGGAEFIMISYQSASTVNYWFGFVQN